MSQSNIDFYDFGYSHRWNYKSEITPSCEFHCTGASKSKPEPAAIEAELSVELSASLNSALSAPSTPSEIESTNQKKIATLLHTYFIRRVFHKEQKRAFESLRIYCIARAHFPDSLFSLDEIISVLINHYGYSKSRTLRKRTLLTLTRSFLFRDNQGVFSYISQSKIVGIHRRYNAITVYYTDLHKTSHGVFNQTVMLGQATGQIATRQRLSTQTGVSQRTVSRHLSKSGVKIAALYRRCFSLEEAEKIRGELYNVHIISFIYSDSLFHDIYIAVSKDYTEETKPLHGARSEGYSVRRPTKFKNRATSVLFSLLNSTIKAGGQDYRIAMFRNETIKQDFIMRNRRHDKRPESEAIGSVLCA